MKDKMSKRLKLLFVSDDKFPPFRVDVSVLFKEKMIGRGHSIDWIMQSEGAFDKSKIIEDVKIARNAGGHSTFHLVQGWYRKPPNCKRSQGAADARRRARRRTSCTSSARQQSRCSTL